jgi:hypothetical protein
MPVSIWFDKYTVRVDEEVTLCGSATPLEDIQALGYVNGRLRAIFLLPLKSRGVNCLKFIPGELPAMPGDNVEFIGVGTETGNRSSPVRLSIVSGPPQKYTLRLSVSKDTVERDERVRFTIEVEPRVSYAVTLKAFVDSALKDSWNVGITHGVGTIWLIPSRIGDVVTWQAEDPYGNKSNTVTTRVTAPVPPTPPAPPTTPPAPPPTPTSQAIVLAVITFIPIIATACIVCTDLVTRKVVA